MKWINNYLSKSKLTIDMTHKSSEAKEEINQLALFNKSIYSVTSLSNLQKYGRQLLE